jgi:hypothetical protein
MWLLSTWYDRGLRPDDPPRRPLQTKSSEVYLMFYNFVLGTWEHDFVLQKSPEELVIDKRLQT